MGGRREAGWEECGRQHRGQQRISCCCGFFDLAHSLSDSMAEVLMSDSNPENDRASRDVSLAAYPRGSDANFGDEVGLDALSHFVRGCSKQAKAGRSFSSDHRCTKPSTTISRMPCPPPEFDTTCLPSSVPAISKPKLHLKRPYIRPSPRVREKYQRRRLLGRWL
jgi:hypothetical protein